MKKSDYLELLKNEKNPYGAWIELYEDVDPEKEISGDVSNLIKAFGYILITAPGGKISPLLYEYVSREIREKNPDLIYADEDVWTDRRYRPFFKPDFSPDTLQSFFFIGGLAVIKKTVIDEYCKSNPGAVVPTEINDETLFDLKKLVDYIFDKDYSKHKSLYESSIVHIPKVLYHADRERDYKYEKAQIKYLNNIAPNKISAIILSKDNPGVLLSNVKSLLRSVKKTTADDELEVIVVDNGSHQENKDVLEKALPLLGAKYYYNSSPFEYSTLCNFGAQKASGDYFLFLNDDVFFEKNSDDNPLLKMLTFAKKKHVGAVGIKLLFPGNENYPFSSELSTMGDVHAIQHAGISLMTMGPSHKLATYADNQDYYFGRNVMPYNSLAVTGACLLVSKDKFELIDGFDEKIKIAYTDVDLCMDLFEKGFYNVCLNDTWAYHFESLSRGNDVIQKEKADRLKRERNIFFEKHTSLKEKGDIFIGPNITKIRLDYSVDFCQEWEKMIFQEALETVSIHNLKDFGIKEAKDGEILGHIDRVKYIPTSSDNLPSYYEIEGWMILHKVDQINAEIYIGLLDSDNFRIYPVQRKYREDIATVFPKEKNCEMSGFVVRIDDSEFERYKESQICLTIKTEKNFFGKTSVKYKVMEEEICLGS